MNTPVIAVIIVVVFMAGSALPVMNKASNTSYKALCAPTTLRHHFSAGCLITTADLRYRGDRHLL